jgi:mycothiol system anti-sigma-R factor
MKCEEVHPFLDTYLDGELDSARQLEVEEHLALCPICQSQVEERREFRSFFAANVAGDKAPPQLEAKVLAAVRRAQAQQKPALSWLPWAYATAVVVVSVFLALKILFPDAEKELSQQAVLRHSYSLSGEHLVDVASPNPAIVKPWLTARLNFAPPVVGSPASGYSLVGGRIDVIQNRSVATLVYKHDKDVVTLFCWPPDKERLSKTDRSIEGYRVSTWGNAQCNYILVSQLSDRAMDEFTDSFRVRIQSGAYF